MFYKNKIKFYLSYFLIAILLILLVSKIFLNRPDYYDVKKTNEYLKTVSWEKYISHTKLLMKNSEEIVLKYSDPEHPGYVNLNLIKQKEEELKGISREKVLQKLYRETASKYFSRNTVLQELVNNLQIVLFHSVEIQPLYEDGKIVSDPLVLLELGFGRCGHAARLAVDLFLASRHQSRYIQTAHHIIAEVMWNNEWRFLPVDNLTYVNIIALFGFWPSFEDLLENPDIIDRYPVTAWENMLTNSQYIDRVIGYNSYYYFGNDINHSQSGYWKKINSSNNQWQSDKYYGWNNLFFQPLNIKKISPRYLPKIPSVTIKTENNEVHFQLNTPTDTDGDFLQFTFYVSNQSRGWVYGELPKNIEVTIKTPSYNQGLYQTEEENLNITLNPGTYYLNIIAQDKRSLENPNIFYPPSREYKFEVQ